MFCLASGIALADVKSFGEIAVAAATSAMFGVRIGVENALN